MARDGTAAGVWGNAALLLGSLLAALVLAEIVLRLVPSLIGVPVLAHFPVPLRQEVAERIGLASLNDYKIIATSERFDAGPALYHPAPGSMFVTAADPADLALGAVEGAPRDVRGFCNTPEMAERKQVDVVVVGDSFTTCTAIAPADTSSAQLQAISGRNTYNLGVAGVGPYEYVELLRHYAPGLKPRMVIFNIYEGNDLRDAQRYADFRRTGEERRGAEGAWDRLLSLSYAASYIVAAGDWLLSDWEGVFGLGESFRYSGRSQGSAVAMNVSNRDQGEVRDARRLAEGKISIDLWAEPLAAFKELSVAQGFVPLVTYTPAMYTAYNDTVEFADPKIGTAMRGLSEAQREWLARKTAELGLAFIDLTPAFREAVKSGPLTHFPANVHLTPFGQKVTAEAWKPEVEKALGRPSP